MFAGKRVAYHTGHAVAWDCRIAMPGILHHVTRRDTVCIGRMCKKRRDDRVSMG